MLSVLIITAFVMSLLKLVDIGHFFATTFDFAASRYFPGCPYFTTSLFQYLYVVIVIVYIADAQNHNNSSAV